MISNGKGLTITVQKTVIMCQQVAIIYSLCVFFLCNQGWTNKAKHQHKNNKL